MLMAFLAIAISVISRHHDALEVFATVFSLRLTQCYCGQIALLAACHRNCKIIVVNVHSSIDNNGGTRPGSL